MELVVGVFGGLIVLAAAADMVNTLVTTSTSNHRFWLTRRYYDLTWGVTRSVAARITHDDRHERLLAWFAPLSVLGLLAVWVVQQIIGFGLIWWSVSGVSGASSLSDSIYFSGVVFFTVGFGEVVPVETVPRFGALVEAFAGVITTALMIGYLPSLYSAYSERERMLMTLDDGSETRITPTSLVISQAPDADPRDLVAFLDRWESWVAGVLETHTTFPMLRLFRSKHAGQNWIAALGLVADAALHCEFIKGADQRSPYWTIRRSIVLFETLTWDTDLSEYRARFEAGRVDDTLFRRLYEALASHGFELYAYDEARVRSRTLRSHFDASLEYLIDTTLAPRGFWGHTIGHSIDNAASSLLDGEA